MQHFDALKRQNVVKNEMKMEDIFGCAALSLLLLAGTLLCCIYDTLDADVVLRCFRADIFEALKFLGILNQSAI